jgi:hypothetical protein
MADAFEVRPCNGLISGDTIQFVAGAWPDEVGGGVALSDEAFTLIEPLLSAASPSWTDAHRYGVFDLPAAARRSLSQLLHTEALRYPAGSEERTNVASLFTELAEWLELQGEEGRVAILGY